MSKKKVKKEELEWAADPAPEKVEDLAGRAAEALAGLIDNDEPNSDLDFLEAASEGELSEEETALVDDEALTGDAIVDEETPAETFSAEGTELAEFSSATIDVEENLPEERIASIVESLLFATDRPQSVAALKAAFKGTNVRSAHIRKALEQLQIDYAGAMRGVSLAEVSGGYQLRTKVDNMEYLRRTVKARPFRVSGPALEVLAIVAYRQPVTKAQIDEVRGVESGHLLRALMEKGLVHFAGRSDLPGKPMLYATARRFLEIFGLRNLNELPSLSEIDQLIPEGIGDETEKEETLGDLTGKLSQEAGATYSEAEDELLKIAADLEQVATTTEFFEQEKQRQKMERDRDRARDLRDALTVGEEISDPDRRWLEKYEAAQVAADPVPVAVEPAPPIAEPGAEPT